MRFLRFDLNLLAALDVLLSERNVTRAAERLNIGQSAASSALGRLRDYFQDDLLVPSGRGLRLTALALTLVEPVRATLRQAQATLQMQPGFDPASSTRSFTVAASDYVMHVLMHDVVRDVALQAPGLRLNLKRREPTVTEQLDRGEVDLLVVPDFFPAAGHPSEPLFTDHYVCIAWKDHPDIKGRLSLARYLALPHVASRQSPTRPYALEDAHLPLGAGDRQVQVFIDDFISVPELIVGTNRIATVQRRLAERARQRGLPLKLLAVPFGIPALNETIRWHPTASADPALQWLRACIKARARR